MRHFSIDFVTIICIIHIQYYLITFNWEGIVTAKALKKTLKDQGINITGLARRTGFNRVYLSNVINGHFVGLNARKAIAEALNKDFNELWGDQINSAE